MVTCKYFSDNSVISLLHVLMCIVWGRSPCIHHHHQLIRNRAESWRPFQVVSTLRKTQSRRTACTVTRWWLWAS